MSISDLPGLNALLNGISTVFLIIGFYFIKKGKKENHRKMMIGALISSAFFLSSYLVYHAVAGSVPYPYHDWTRYLYFAILIPHIILAAVMTPFILYAVLKALQADFEKHLKVVKWVWPVWMYVSVTGVIIYYMVYQL
jgi:putative membrane protein